MKLNLNHLYVAHFYKKFVFLMVKRGCDSEDFCNLLFYVRFHNDG